MGNIIRFYWPKFIHFILPFTKVYRAGRSDLAAFGSRCEAEENTKASTFWPVGQVTFFDQSGGIFGFYLNWNRKINFILRIIKEYFISRGGKPSL